MKNIVNFKIFEIVFVSIIISLCFLPGIGIFFFEDNVSFEKREKIAFNTILEKGILRKDIFSDLEVYFSDNFYLRRQIIHRYSKINNKWFGLPLVNEVLIGEDGWLFFNNKHLMKSYKNLNILDENALLMYKEKFDNFYNTLKENNISFYFFLAPNKSSIYNEFMPPYIKKINDISRAEQMSQNLNSNYFLDLTKDIKSFKKMGFLYYKNDTHWNRLGGFLGFLTFYNTFLSRDFNFSKLNINDFSIEQQNIFRKGDLDNMLGHEEEKDAIDFKIEFSDNEFNVEMINEYKHFITKNPNGEKLKVLIYRDSFFSNMYEYFSKTFFEVEFIWNFELDLDLIIKNKYDIVILECVERNVDAIEIPK
ncbi:MAG: hypothetical protein M0R46_01815 [Candidatus Muirbacterium halophilum]|nr:hypothetical protein [Candidatus Muirbacterium halophilum]MCK9474632.1 hypothetical protein [Candidatus Muirbacterium halophilum]